MPDIFEYASPQERERLKQVEKVYEELDLHIARFQKLENFGCQPGCGRCCENPHIEATVLEVLPLAFELHRLGQAHIILDKIDKAKKDSYCIFYQPHPALLGHGRCMVYQKRPLLCRLFGFSASQDKMGKKHLVTCAVIKEKYPDKFFMPFQAASRFVNRAPLMHDYSLKISNIDLDLGRTRFKINEAVSQALKRSGLWLLKQHEQ